MDLSLLPQIDRVLNHEKFKDFNKGILAFVARTSLEQIRKNPDEFELSKDEVFELIKQNYEKIEQKAPKKVINATGVVIHTNLGRSVIGEQIWQEATSIATGYSTLEYDLAQGKRGNRYDYSGLLFAALFGCEDALVVNNNAAAVFLVLNTFAKGGECVVSRGELVEIGGGFRVPDVMRESGTKLAEIGTTNKTRISDYEGAINEQTKMLLKVHPSNFEIVGFNESADLEQIANLAKSASKTWNSKILSYYDLGGGAVNALKNCAKEPVIGELLKSGVDLISFSADKLFGSIQAGVILGPKELIAKLRKNQLLRMLRSDKITLELLNAATKAYLDKNYKKIPTIELLSRSKDDLIALADEITAKITTKAKITQTSSYAGGGTLPNHAISSIALAFESKKASVLEQEFRKKGVIGRIENECFVLDLRSVLASDVNELISVINEIFGAQK